VVPDNDPFVVWVALFGSHHKCDGFHRSRRSHWQVQLKAIARWGKSPSRSGLPQLADSKRETTGNQKCLRVLKEKEKDLKRVFRVTN
jgi:hypothetical protein